MEIFFSLQKWIKTSSRRKKWFTVLFLISFIATGILLITSGGASPNTAVEPDPFYFAGIIIKLISVLLLIIGGAILLRRWQLKGGFQRKAGQLSIIETIRLSPRQAVHLVRVGDRQVLIGATDQSITVLTPIEARMIDEQPESAASPRSAINPAFEFTQVLEAVSGKRQIPETDGLNTAVSQLKDPNNW